MKKNRCAVLFFFTLCATFCSADTWTSVKGEKLEGEFIGYNFSTQRISIERTYDGRVFAIPETQLVLSDRIKAVRLEYKNTPSYWYVDYEKAKAENPNSRCMVLYRNSAAPEAFELFYTKLLLRDDFRKLLQRKNVVVCVQTNGELPEEVEYRKISEYFTHGYGSTSNDPVRRYKKYFDDPKIPLAIYVDFRGDPIPNLQKLEGRHWQKHWHPLYTYPLESNPFKPPTVTGDFIPLKNIDTYIESFSSR